MAIVIKKCCLILQKKPKTPEKPESGNLKSRMGSRKLKIAWKIAVALSEKIVCTDFCDPSVYSKSKKKNLRKIQLNLKNFIIRSSY